MVSSYDIVPAWSWLDCPWRPWWDWYRCSLHHWKALCIASQFKNVQGVRSRNCCSNLHHMYVLWLALLTRSICFDCSGLVLFPLKIGENVFIDDDCIIKCLSIGSNVKIGRNSVIVRLKPVAFGCSSVWERRGSNWQPLRTQNSLINACLIAAVRFFQIPYWHLVRLCRRLACTVDNQDAW